MTTTTAPLPGDYETPTDYLFGLLFTAYAPVRLEAEAASRRDDEGWITSPAGVAAVQRHVADDPRADIPDWLRASLREWADRHTT